MSILWHPVHCLTCKLYRSSVQAPGNLRPEPGTPRVVRPAGESYTPFNQSDSSSRSRSTSSVENTDTREGHQTTSDSEKHTDTCDGTNGTTSEGEDSVIRRKGKKSAVGRLLPPGNSPLPQPWSHKTGSESESEESVSHTGLGVFLLLLRLLPLPFLLLCLPPFPCLHIPFLLLLHLPFLLVFLTSFSFSSSFLLLYLPPLLTLHLPFLLLLLFFS